MLIRAYGYKIRGMKTPPLPPPADAPFLYENLHTNAVALKWRCSPGARYYVVERATSSQGPWEGISGDLDISYDLYFYPMFSDSHVVSRSEEHTYALQSLMRITYSVFCLNTYIRLS